MPRLRSVTPPPRRPSASDHTPRKRRVIVKSKTAEVKDEQAELKAQPVRTGSSKQDLIRQHVVGRAERHKPGNSLFVISAAAVTAVVVGIGWWISLGIGEDKTLPEVAPIAISTEQTLTPQDTSATSTFPLDLSAAGIVPTTTERKLLVPLSSTSSPSTR